MSVTINGTTGITAPAATLATPLPRSSGGTAANDIPVFRAWLGLASQTVTGTTWTKATLDTKEYDTATAFSTVNNRFQPTVAGYYSISGGLIASGSTGTTVAICGIYKNGVQHDQGVYGTQYGGNAGSNVSGLVYLNGSTDYVELWGFVAGTGTFNFLGGSPGYVYLSGVLVRAA